MKSFKQYISEAQSTIDKNINNSEVDMSLNRKSDNLRNVVNSTINSLSVLPSAATSAALASNPAAWGAERISKGSAKLGAAGLVGYALGKAGEAAMDTFDPEQETYAKIGSALTGGPEKIERKGAPGTQEEYTKAAREAAARRKARYGSEDDRGELVAVPSPAPKRMPPDVGRYGPVRPPITIPAPKN
tara:strand:+ start:879 stop:1442 length:564 start_codon:yes stop_codon:yes gene_type:complete